MVKTKIEWCDSSWSPVTGCYHDCEYCYARKIANRYKGCNESPDGVAPGNIVTINERLSATTKNGETRGAAYPFGFTPTFHQYRLSDPWTKGFGKNIFVCSMADLFGDWVPDLWIEKVFESCKKASNHRYLFLTKNPKRYLELAERGKLPTEDYFWYGSTAERPTDAVFWSTEHKTFVSFEPLLEPFEKVSEDNPILKVDWAIIGAETGNRKDKVVPEKSWVDAIVDGFKLQNKAVFMKDSLIPVWGENILTEFPWED